MRCRSKYIRDSYDFCYHDTLSSPFKRKVNLHEISAYDFLQANLHELSDVHPEEPAEYFDAVADTNDNTEPSDSILVNAATTSKGRLPPGDIRRVMRSEERRVGKECRP